MIPVDGVDLLTTRPHAMIFNIKSVNILVFLFKKIFLYLSSAKSPKSLLMERKVNSLRPSDAYICIGNLIIIASDDGLLPNRRKAITWSNAGILLFRPLGTNFSQISIKIHTFSFKKMHLKTSSAKRRPFCLGLNVLTHYYITRDPLHSSNHMWALCDMNCDMPHCNIFRLSTHINTANYRNVFTNIESSTKIEKINLLWVTAKLS